MHLQKQIELDNCPTCMKKTMRVLLPLNIYKCLKCEELVSLNLYEDEILVHDKEDVIGYEYCDEGCCSWPVYKDTVENVA